MEIHILLIGVVVLIVLSRWYASTNKGPKQVLTLKAGETFLGVLDRGKSDSLFIGDAPGRAYRNITAEEVKLLKQVLESGRLIHLPSVDLESLILEWRYYFPVLGSSSVGWGTPPSKVCPSPQETAMGRSVGSMQILQYAQSADGNVETILCDDGSVERRAMLHGTVPHEKGLDWSP